MSRIIAVDFDGTIVEHRFPEIGRPIPGAFAWLREFAESGARLILFTMRSDARGAVGIKSPEGHEPNRGYLTEAVEFCRANGVEFWGVNENPEQGSWTASPKPYAHLYIDDAALGCPLVHGGPRERPCVDWSLVGPMVRAMLKEPALC